MAFQLTKTRVVTWPVILAMPVDGGKVQEHTCTAKFEIIPQDDYNSLMTDDLKFLDRVVVGFGDDIKDEDGEPLTFNSENKRHLFASAGFVRLGFINAYHEASAGIASKNSKGPLASGRSVRKSRKKK
jgi:hypothetical protein